MPISPYPGPYDAAPSTCEICHGSGYDERTRKTLHKQRCPNGCAVAGDDLVEVAAIAIVAAGYNPATALPIAEIVLAAVRDQIAADEREKCAMEVDSRLILSDFPRDIETIRDASAAIRQRGAK